MNEIDGIYIAAMLAKLVFVLVIVLTFSPRLFAREA